MQHTIQSPFNLNVVCRKGAQQYFLLPLMVVIILLSSLCSNGLAAEAYTEISAPLLKHLMETDENVLVVNVLSDIEYEMHHITGSINIPINVIKDSVKLPADKSTPLVFYCMGTRWLYSKKAAVWAVKNGYTNVHRLIGGIPEWRSFHYPMTSSEEYAGMPAKKLSTQEVEELLQTEELFILDVRPVSFSHCNMFLKNTFHLPLLVLADNLQNIPRDQKILITDSAAKQAQLAYKFLVKKGFQVIGVLRGGLEVWCSEGRASEERVIEKEKIQLIGDDTE